MVPKIKNLNLGVLPRTREINKREDDKQPKTNIQVNLNPQLNISLQLPIIGAISKRHSRCTKGRLNTLA